MNDPHEINRCCCKWHGSACCYDQWLKAEKRVADHLANLTPTLGDPDLRCGKAACALGHGHAGRCRT